MAKKKATAKTEELPLADEVESVVHTKWQSLAEAQAAVMKAVPYVQKKDGGAGLRYSFAGEADLIRKLRPAMLRHGIVVSPVNVEEMQDEGYSTAKGGRMSLVWARYTFRFTHIHSGEFQDCCVMGEAADGGDKRYSKAATIALKYALRQFFLIETGDDPDEFAHERGAVNERDWKRAATAIAEKTTVEELDELWQKFQTPALGFDEAQRVQLAKLIRERKDSLSND